MTVLTNARLVLGDEVILGTVTIDGTVIGDVARGASGAGGAAQDSERQ